MYPDPRVSEFVSRHFVPVRAHVKHQAALYKELSERFSGVWTPTILVLDSGGQERHRVEGFLPAEELLAQLTLGLGHAAFAAGDFAVAEQHFRDVLARYSGTDGAPEAQYWAGVSRYKASGDATALAETARAFQARYSDTSWAKKSAVWQG